MADLWSEDGFGDGGPVGDDDGADDRVEGDESLDTAPEDGFDGGNGSGDSDDD